MAGQIGKGFSKDCSNGRGTTPMFPCQPCRFKLASSPSEISVAGNSGSSLPHSFSFRRYDTTLPQFRGFFTHRKEEGVEGFAEFLS